MSWPAGVNDNTALPYAVWQVLDTLNEHSPQETARLLGLSPDQLQQAVQFASEQGERQSRQERPVDDDLAEQVGQALMTCVGPIGSIMVEDALEDFGATRVTLAQLLRSLSTELQESQQQAFARQLRSRNLI